MDIDVEKIFGKKEENTNYPQPIVSQEDRPVEETMQISALKKILIHLFFIITLGFVGAFAFYSFALGMFSFSVIFGERMAIFIIALSIAVFFVIFYLYDKWRRKYDPNSVLFKKW